MIDKNAENHFVKELHYWGIDRHHRKVQEQILKKLDRSGVKGAMNLASETFTSPNYKEESMIYSPPTEPVQKSVPRYEENVSKTFLSPPVKSQPSSYVEDSTPAQSDTTSEHP